MSDWENVGPVCKCCTCQEMQAALDIANDPDFDVEEFLVLSEFIEEVL